MYFKLTHFSKLESHSGPVRRLYRQILRQTTRLPLSHARIEKLLACTRYEFKRYKNMMSGHIARDQILRAFRYEKELRLAIRSGNASSILLELAKHLAEDPKLPRIVLADHEILNPPPRGEGLEYVRRLSKKFITRHVAIDRLQRKRQLSLKSQLDDVYVSLFVVPESKAFQESKTFRARRRAQTQKPRNVSVLSLSLPRNRPFTLLRVTGWQDSRVQRSTVCNAIKRYHDDKDTTRLNEQYELAAAHARDTGQQEWVAPIQQSMAARTQRDKQVRTKLLYHRRCLIARKARLDQFFRLQWHKRIKYWRSQTPPLTYCTHKDLRDLFHPRAEYPSMA